ncbi:MAG: helix-turn-helix domain-containing protein [Myxococcota bacterium]|nr:helix-turn-helix domain-containing protein [Myxococcota bacterium]
MSGFYERLGTRAGASDEQIREGYQQALARLVKKLRNARAQGADTSVIEAQRDALREAFEVLTDAARRRRYDLMMRLDLEGLPTDAEELWDRVEGGLVDPTAAAAVEVVRALTDLDLGEPFTPREEERTEPARPPVMPAPQLPPRPKAVSLLSQQEREERAHHASAPLPEPGHLPQVSMPQPSVAVPTNPGLYVAPEVHDPSDLLDGPRVALPTGASHAEGLEQVADNLGYDGRYLKTAREGRGMSLEQVSEETKIAVRYLQAIEDNDVERLPAAVFVRGYLREIAAVLEIEESALVEGYMAFYNSQRGN